MTQTPTDALRLVPVEPTEAMLNAAIEAFPRSHPSVFPIIYRYMVEAAPASPLPEGGGWRTDFENAPDCEEGILIVDATKISPAVGTARFIDGEWCGYDHGHGVECLWPSPTHWMPLPAAPTGEAK